MCQRGGCRTQSLAANDRFCSVDTKNTALKITVSQQVGKSILTRLALKAGTQPHRSMRQMIMLHFDFLGMSKSTWTSNQCKEIYQCMQTTDVETPKESDTALPVNSFLSSLAQCCASCQRSLNYWETELINHMFCPTNTVRMSTKGVLLSSE